MMPHFFLHGTFIFRKPSCVTSFTFRKNDKKYRVKCAVVYLMCIESTTMGLETLCDIIY